MKKNIKTYVDIEEIKYNSLHTYYKVSFITTYDITIFGLYITTKTKTYEVPFWFRSLDIAKDFCEINPKIEHTYIVNGDDDSRKVYYETYRLEVNEQKFYIKWTDWSIKIDDSYNYSFELHTNRVVDKFVSWISLTNWMHTFSLDNVYFNNEYSKLSELVSVKTKKGNKNNKHWRFELVKNEDQ